MTTAIIIFVLVVLGLAVCGLVWVAIGIVGEARRDRRRRVPRRYDRDALARQQARAVLASERGADCDDSNTVAHLENLVLRDQLLASASSSEPSPQPDTSVADLGDSHSSGGGFFSSLFDGWGPSEDGSFSGSDLGGSSDGGSSSHDSGGGGGFDGGSSGGGGSDGGW